MTKLIEMLPYLYHLGILICLYLILCQSFNLVFGLGKLLNLAHIAGYSLGAYATALLCTELHWSFWVAAPCSMVVSAFLALLVGAIATKLSDDYFALGTLAFAAIVSALEINWKSLTKGVLGIPEIPRPSSVWGINFESNESFFWLLFLITLLCLIFFSFLFRSRFCRDLRAQAENSFAAQALGKNVRGIRNDALIISSMFAGLAGAFFATYISYIDPSSFSLAEMVFVLSVVIIGKPGSLLGGCLSTIFLVLLPEALREVHIPSEYLGPTRQMLYSVILFGVLYWKREALFPQDRRI